MSAQGAVDGIRLARSCLLKSTLVADFQLLFEELLEARPGPIGCAPGRHWDVVAERKEDWLERIP
jgi:hypothetical protein